MGEFRGKFPQEKIFTRAKSAGKKSGVEYPVNVREEIFREGGKGIFTEKYPHVWGVLAGVRSKSYASKQVSTRSGCDLCHPG